MSRIDYKTILNKFNKSEIIQNLLSDHNGIKLEVNNRCKFGKFINIWKLTHTNK